MRDYTNYHTSTDEKMISGGKRLFQLHCSSKEGANGLIDGIEYSFIIQKHVNPLNQGIDENILICASEVNIKCGSVVVVDGVTYLVTSQIDDDTLTKTCLIRISPITLSFYKNNVLYHIPAVSNSGTVRTTSGKYFNDTSSYYALMCPSGYIDRNDLNLRFIIKKFAYKIDDINDIEIDGLILLQLSTDEKNNGDNTTLEIADYNDNQPIEPIIEDIQGLNIVTVGTQKSYSVNDITDLSWRLYADDGISSTDLAEIISIDGGLCTIKTNMYPKYGYIQLKCWNTDNSFNSTKRIKIISTI